MGSLDVVSLHSGNEPTFIRGEASSIVDLTFVSTTLAKRNCSWRVTDIYTASEHRAILWETCSDQRVALVAKKTNSAGWRVSTFDPGSYSAALDDRPISGSSATEKARSIMKRVAAACDATMTRKRTTNRHPPVYWWNETIAILRKKCNAARRLSQRGQKKPYFEELHIRYKKARRKPSKAIKFSKKQSWSELLDEVERDPWGRPYKVVMTRLKSQPMPSPTCPVLMKRIVTVLFPQQSELHRTSQQGEVLMVPQITREQLMVRRLIDILERIFHQRIEAAVEPLLAGNQYGFRKGRSTLEAINLVVDTAREAISGKKWLKGKKKYCLVATLDIKNAFNSPRWNCIMDALVKSNVPGYLRRMVASYFSGRILKYDTECDLEQYRVTGGVPQGSILGPLLWNIMYDGLLKLELPRETKLVAFANDVAVVIVGKYLEEINFTFDKTFETIRRWMDSAGLHLAEHKTEAVLITSRKIIETVTLQLQEARRKIIAVYRLSALRVASAYRTVSEDAVCIISGMLPIELLAEERRSLYQRKRSEALSPEELEIQVRRKSLSRWQQKWTDSTKGRWTHRLIPHVAVWVEIMER
ncbi:uncharacterized protein LOC107039043 [Diachasma alloeum]|uniref:uncharacterized protein LOC107039043 n=1 Tax=Diachasma alloeum TaxID=454923 RepID=UPI0007383F04|nr:uncharacterized protein LOC107039043 [Diachasma alloeum]